MPDISAYLAQFAETWNLFIKWRLPAFLDDDNEDTRFGLIDGKPALARIMMPLVGALAGVCLYLPFWGMSLVFGHVAGGIAAAVLAPAAIEFATGWRGLSALTAYFQLRRAGASHEEAFLARPQSMTEPRPPVSMIGMLVIYALRMLMFGVLASVYCSFWFIIVLTGGYLVRMHLCGMNEPGGSVEDHWYPLPDERMQKYGWWIGFVVMLIAGVFHIPAALTGFLFAGCMAWLAKQLCLDSISGINRQAVDVFGYMAEIILLFVGVLLFTGPAL